MQIKDWVADLTYLQLRHYVIHNEEIRSCPNPTCSSAGFVSIDINTGYIECEKPLQCLECDFVWRDPLQRITQGAFLARMHARFRRSYQRSASKLCKLLISKPCPQCSTLIQKIGGCPRMICYKCKCSFCWSCLSSYPHNVAQINNCL